MKERPSSERFHHMAVAAFLACLIFLLIPLIPPLSRTSGSPGAQAGQEENFKIKTNVEWVVLHVAVRDRNGNIVPGLNSQNFRVYEDKKPQEIESFSQEDIPVAVGLVVDDSGSMARKHADVVAAALAFAHSSNPKDEMFVVNFNEEVTFGLPAGMPFTDRPDLLLAALSIKPPQGKTALYDAISYALGHLKTGARDKRALIVVSDGGDNASGHTLSQIKDEALHSEAIIYTIGIFDPDDPDRNPGVLKELAKETGGEAFFPETIKDVTPDCQQIALDLRHQYTIAYVPTNKAQDGSYRSVKLTAEGPNHERLNVRTRTGYYAPSSPHAKDNEGAATHGNSH
jgi:Ca-activated chloride channel homolog